MSINPEHVNNIISGEKTYEFRKVKCKRKIDSIVIYSTAPIMQVVAEVKVLDLIQGKPDDVWIKTCKGAGINKLFLTHIIATKKQHLHIAQERLNALKSREVFPIME